MDRAGGAVTVAWTGGRDRDGRDAAIILTIATPRSVAVMLS